MTTEADVVRWRAVTLGLALAATMALALTACGSGSGQQNGGGGAMAISAACTEVSGALADGPDPDSDPVGYAEAQIKPLRAIVTSDSALCTAIDDLSAAYAQVFAGNGTSASASKAVAAATSKVRAICPGAAA